MIQIEWPVRMAVPDAVIERLFARAVAQWLVPVHPRTIKAMAEALENAGMIRLQRKSNAIRTD
jgi:hypothetical protein